MGKCMESAMVCHTHLSGFQEKLKSYMQGNNILPLALIYELDFGGPMDISQLTHEGRRNNHMAPSHSFNF